MTKYQPKPNWLAYGRAIQNQDQPKNLASVRLYNKVQFGLWLPVCSTWCLYAGGLLQKTDGSHIKRPAHHSIMSIKRGPGEQTRRSNLLV